MKIPIEKKLSAIHSALVAMGERLVELLEEDPLDDMAGEVIADMKILHDLYWEIHGDGPVIETKRKRK
jgi:hypothetical protein